MPTYEYACTACGQHLEVHQRLTDDPLTTCGACGGALRKVFHPAGIVFKGSGFYATDSRSGSKSSAGSSGGSTGSTDAAGSSSSSTTASDASASPGTTSGSDASGSTSTTTAASSATPAAKPAAPAKATT